MPCAQRPRTRRLFRPTKFRQAFIYCLNLSLWEMKTALKRKNLESDLEILTYKLKSILFTIVRLEETTHLLESPQEFL